MGQISDQIIFPACLLFLKLLLALHGGLDLGHLQRYLRILRRKYFRSLPVMAHKVAHHHACSTDYLALPPGSIDY